MRVYLAGPMAGFPAFNYPMFHRYAAGLRGLGHFVFNPAERDERNGVDISRNNKTGDIKQAEAEGFSLREAMAEDTAFLCTDAEAIAMIPGWERSMGAYAEWALARALGLPVIYLTGDP